jgi:hypothetical protein
MMLLQKCPFLSSRRAVVAWLARWRRWQTHLGKHLRLRRLVALQLLLHEHGPFHEHTVGLFLLLVQKGHLALKQLQADAVVEIDGGVVAIAVDHRRGDVDILGLVRDLRWVCRSDNRRRRKGRHHGWLFHNSHGRGCCRRRGHGQHGASVLAKHLRREMGLVSQKELMVVRAEFGAAAHTRKIPVIFESKKTKYARGERPFTVS